jgi:hypothetical protein
MSSTRSANQYKVPKAGDSSTAELKKANVKENKTEKKEGFVHKQTPSGSTIDAQAREWFRSLSSEERSGAARFSDRAFIGTFLALSTQWLATTATASTTTATTQSNDNHVSLSGE